MSFFRRSDGVGNEEARALSPETGRMLDVIIALIPAAFAGIAVFGIRAAVLIAAAVTSSVLFEHLYSVIKKAPTTIGDLSAVVTGLVLAFSLPVKAPLYVPVFGSAVAIILVKLLSGGKGKNFLNPAITARAALYIAFTPSLLRFTVPARNPVDAVSCATPLKVLSQLDMSADIGQQLSTLVEKGELPGLINMLFGVRAGCIGEGCAIALILGGVYLILRGVISFALPVTYLGAFTVCSFIFSGFSPVYTLYYALSGAVIFGAFFVFTDPVTGPDTLNKQLITGTAAGILTATLRFFTPLPEGVTVSVLLMNLTLFTIKIIPLLKARIAERKNKENSEENSELPDEEISEAENEPSLVGDGVPDIPPDSTPSAEETPSEAENEPSLVGEGSPLPSEETDSSEESSPVAENEPASVGEGSPLPSEEADSSEESSPVAENEPSLVGDGVPDIPPEEADAPSEKASKPVLVNAISPDSSPVPQPYPVRQKKQGRKAKKKQKQMPDFSEPLPEVIPEFLKKEIERQKADKGE